MTLTNAIAKAKKELGSEPVKDGQFYNFSYGPYTLSFAQNGRSDEATNFYTKKTAVKDDITTDYFSGTFHDNLTKAIKFIKVAYTN